MSRTPARMGGQAPQGGNQAAQAHGQWPQVPPMPGMQQAGQGQFGQQAWNIMGYMPDMSMQDASWNQFQGQQFMSNQSHGQQFQGQHFHGQQAQGQQFQGHLQQGMSHQGHQAGAPMQQGNPLPPLPPPPAASHQAATGHGTVSPAYKPSEPPAMTKWVSDEYHFDRTESFGLPLPRTVNATKWSDEHHLSGRSPFDIRLWEVVPFKQDNYIFRAMAAGRWIGVEYVRNARESQLMGTFLKQIREARLNLDNTIEQVCADNNQNAATTEGRTEAFNIIARKLASEMHSMTHKPAHDSGAAQQLSQQVQLNAQLQAEIQNLKDQIHAKEQSPHKPERPTTGTASTVPGTPSTPLSASPLGKYGFGTADKDRPEQHQQPQPVADDHANLGALLQALSAHPAKQQEVLGHNSPTTFNEVENWISGLKLPADKKKQLQTTLQKYESLTSRSNAPNLQQSKDLLVRYGIPSNKANSYKLKPAVRLLITATFLLE